MNNQFTLRTLTQAQKMERYKALLIIGNIHALTPSVGRAIASALEAVHISIVDEFIMNPSHCTNIDTFDTDDMKKLLRNKTSPSDEIVLVEDIGMLFSVWSAYERTKFLRMVEMDTISPYKNIVYIFLCLKDEQLKKCGWVNDVHHWPRVLDVNDIVLGGYQ